MVQLFHYISQCNNNRNKVHNKCDALESSPNQPTLWSVEKLSSMKLVKVAQSYPTLCNPMGCGPPRLLCPWDSSGKNTGMGCLSLLQGIFPTQGLNPGHLRCMQILYHLSHQDSPMKPVPGAKKIGDCCVKEKKSPERLPNTTRWHWFP